MERYDAYISLGFNCEAGLQFRRLGYEESSLLRFAFIENFGALINLLERDFEDLFLNENLRYHYGLVRDVKAEIRFHAKILDHLDTEGFKSTCPEIDTLYELDRSKINHLISKWRELDESGKKVLYFYIPNENKAGKDEAQKLFDAMTWRFPNHDFTILFIQPEDKRERDWGLERLRNVYLAFTAPRNNAYAADEEGWNLLFKQYQLSELLLLKCKLVSFATKIKRIFLNRK